MPRICDRSPCDGLLLSLGNFIFGSKTGVRGAEGFTLQVAVKQNAKHRAPFKRKIVEIEYCPFCGTRIEEVNAAIVNGYMRPKKYRKNKALNTV